MLSVLSEEYLKNSLPENNGYIHSLTTQLSSTIREVKEQVAEELRLDSKSLTIPDLEKICEQGNPDYFRIEEINKQIGEIENLKFKVILKGRSEEYIMPDVITVQVMIEGEAQPRVFPVEVIKFTGKKSYNGGYYHKKTHRVYHHANSQTILSKYHYGKSTIKAHRETQTYQMASRSQQTTREHGTQMTTKTLSLSETNDKYVIPRPYIHSSQHQELCTEKVVVIQCYWRGYRARCRARGILHLKANTQEMHKIIALDNKREEELKHKKEVERRMHPRTADDFEVLYNELNNWRQQETKLIHEQVKDPNEKAKLLENLLKKEVKLLQTIDRLKNTASKENKQLRIKGMLEIMSKPKLWELSDGDAAAVYTPFTNRAKELSDLYQGLCLSLLSIDERLDILVHVKYTVKEFDCSLSREIIDLIDREADLLNRGRSEKSLEGLRKRITNLFLQFIETPAFNPEAVHFKKVIVQNMQNT